METRVAQENGNNKALKKKKTKEPQKLKYRKVLKEIC